MQPYRFAKLIFTVEDGRLRNERTGLETDLRPQAARLLRCLLDNAGELVPRERLFEAIWGGETVVDFDSGLAALLRELRLAIRAVDGPQDAIETVPRRGYRLNARVARDSHRGCSWRSPMILAVLLPVLIAGAFGVWLARDAPNRESPAALSLAILPFEDYELQLGLPEHAGLLIADRLLAELLARPLEGVQMLGRTSLRPYLDREDVVSAIAADLGVDLLIEGAVLARESQGWRAEMRLLAVPPGRVVWSTSAGGEGGSASGVHSAAADMARQLVREWPDIRRRLDPDASDY